MGRASIIDINIQLELVVLGFECARGNAYFVFTLLKCVNDAAHTNGKTSLSDFV